MASYVDDILRKTAPGGGAGASTFLDLTDVVPASYSGAGGEFVKVNAGETGLEFGAVSSTGESNLVPKPWPFWSYTTTVAIGTGTEVIVLSPLLEEGDHVFVGLSADEALAADNPVGYTNIIFAATSTASSLTPGNILAYKVMGPTPDLVVGVRQVVDRVTTVVIQAWRGLGVLSGTPTFAVTTTSVMPHPPAFTTDGEFRMVGIWGALDDEDVAPSVTAPADFSYLITNDTGAQVGDDLGTTAMLAWRLVREPGTITPAAFNGSGSDAWDAATFSFTTGPRAYEYVGMGDLGLLPGFDEASLVGTVAGSTTLQSLSIGSGLSLDGSTLIALGGGQELDPVEITSTTITISDSVAGQNLISTSAGAVAVTLGNGTSDNKSGAITEGAQEITVSVAAGVQYYLESDDQLAAARTASFKVRGAITWMVKRIDAGDRRYLILGGTDHEQDLRGVVLKGYRGNYDARSATPLTLDATVAPAGCTRTFDGATGTWTLPSRIPSGETGSESIVIHNLGPGTLSLPVSGPTRVGATSIATMQSATVEWVRDSADTNSNEYVVVRATS